VVQPVGKKKETGLKRQEEKEKEANETKFALFCSFLQFSLRVFLSFKGAS